MRIELTVIVENSVDHAELLAEHGFACWIQYGSQQILFDTGQGIVLTGNAYKLQLPLQKIDAIVLSHGHYDHTGGLPDALHNNARARVYAHPACFGFKFRRSSDGRSRDIGMPERSQRAVHNRHRPYQKTDRPLEIATGLFATGPIPRVCDFEQTNGSFFLDRDGECLDPLVDDQALFFDTQEGTVVLLGCAHAGVVNTLRYVLQLTNQRPFHAVLGGMHLGGASKERVARTVDELTRLSVQVLGPAHCTGTPAISQLRHAFADRVIDLKVGSRIEFQTVA